MVFFFSRIILLRDVTTIFYTTASSIFVHTVCVCVCLLFSSSSFPWTDFRYFFFLIVSICLVRSLSRRRVLCTYHLSSIINHHSVECVNSSLDSLRCLMSRRCVKWKRLFASLCPGCFITRNTYTLKITLLKHSFRRPCLRCLCANKKKTPNTASVHLCRICDGCVSSAISRLIHLRHFEPPQALVSFVRWSVF